MIRKKGWIRDLPDIRDYTMETESVRPLVAKMTNVVATSADLRKGFSPVENQGDLGSCTANSAAGILEYFEKNTSGKYVDASRLFLYYCARYIGGYFPGDNGAEIRNAMGALALFGACPEKFWKYDINKFDLVPSNACFAMAQKFSAMQYYRLDGLGKTTTEVLTAIKTHLTNGIPVMFGFTCYQSIDDPSVTKSGCIPYPSKNERADGGHAIVMAGFNDTKVIVNPIDKSTTVGAVLIRNSWGTGWGEAGYGWLPYQYILKGLAADYWVMLSASWVDISQFI